MKNLNENDRETILDALEAYKKQAGADRQDAINSTYEKAVSTFNSGKSSSKKGAIEAFKQKNRTDAGLDN
jgi:1,2-phenylacetyl-CoA epoxidase catalytic subunit